MSRIDTNAAKLAFMVHSYPNKRIQWYSKRFVAMTAIDFNCSVWVAEEKGYIKVNQVKKRILKGEDSSLADLGEAIDEEISHLQASIIITLRNFALEGLDVEEEKLTGFTLGFKPHDIMIATKNLLNQGAIRTYRVLDTIVVKEATKKRAAEIAESQYVFYTLPENLEKEFYKEQFKDRGKVRVEILDSVVQ